MLMSIQFLFFHVSIFSFIYSAHPYIFYAIFSLLAPRVLQIQKDASCCEVCMIWNQVMAQ